MDNHQDIRLLISAYVDNAADAAEEKLVLEHLAGCPACRKYLNALKNLSSALKAWPDENLSPDLEQKISQNLLNIQSKEKPMKNEIRLSAFGAGIGVLASFVVLFLFAQTYAQRHLQARVRD